MVSAGGAGSPLIPDNVIWLTNQPPFGTTTLFSIKVERAWLSGKYEEEIAMPYSYYEGGQGEHPTTLLEPARRAQGAQENESVICVLCAYESASLKNTKQRV